MNDSYCRACEIVFDAEEETCSECGAETIPRPEFLQCDLEVYQLENKQEIFH